jgi:hypothetical protein
MFIEYSFSLVEQFKIFERRKINYFHLKFSFAILSSDSGTVLPAAAMQQPLPPIPQLRLCLCGQ